MLSSIVIENFQSHRHTVIDLVSGTNVIIGESDSGKSSILRAITWVCSNRPLGDSFRSEWGGDTRVTLKTVEGHEIIRARTDQRNEYIVNGQVLEAFGTEVPEEVSRILNMDSANIQGQLDPPFLLSSTPGEAAKALNKAASIDEIDHAISGLRKSISRITSAAGLIDEAIKEHTKEAEQYDDLPDLDTALSNLEREWETFDQRKDRVGTIRLVLSALESATARFSKMDHIPALNDDLQKMLETHQEHEDMRNRLMVNKDAAARIEMISARLEATKNSSLYLKKYYVLDSKQQRFWKRVKEYETGAALIDKAKRAQSKLEQAEQTIQQLEEEFGALSPEQCPLCGGDWNA